MSTTTFQNFRLLLWKNWKLQLNHKWRSIFEICTPMLVSFILVGVRLLSKSEYQDEIRYTKSFELENLDLLRQNATEFIDYRLSYSPAECTFCANIMTEVAKNAKVGLYPCESSSMLENITDELQLLAGIDFGDINKDVKSYPRKLVLAIRFPSELRTTKKMIQIWYTNHLFVPLDPYGPRNRMHEDGGTPPGYLIEGFLTIQNQISLAYINLISSKSQNIPSIKIKRFPYPPYIEDHLQRTLTALLGGIILLAYIKPSIYIVKYVTLEREQPLKEVLKLMGISGWIHWMAWFVKFFTTMVMSSTLATCVLTIKWSDNLAVIMNSSFLAILFFLVVYASATITFCFMMATFFRKVNTAVAVTWLYWFLSFLPYAYINMDYDNIPLNKKLMWCSLTNTCMGLGIRVIMDWEMTGEGLNWDNIHEQSTSNDPLTMIHIIYMMLVMTVVHMIVCLYVEQIKPGAFGTPKPWYFPLWIFCCLCSFSSKRSNATDVREEPKYYQKEPEDMDPGIVIRNLTHYYGKTLAVDNLSFNMYINEITVLLGHNGAGKSTIISVLCGMILPTFGTAYIMGHDIRTDAAGARRSLSICPQKNVIFEDLKVEENFKFFCYLRGLRGTDLQEEVDDYIEKTNLGKKRTMLTRDLSVCLRRKLTVCCALCGGPEVVFLDRPTSGMDPTARKHSWNILEQAKEGRTIVLITHFMNEADILADRVAIMAAGKLICYGTPFFLKKTLGCGYKLVCIKRNDCITKDVTSFLKSFIPTLEVSAESDSEIMYVLEEQYAPQFSKMLNQLENKLKDLKITEFGLSIASLDEVFMKTGTETFVIDLKSVEFDSAITSLDETTRIKGLSLKCTQLYSMMLKKYLSTLRNRTLIVLKLLLTIVFVVLSVQLNYTEFYPKQNPFTLKLRKYEAIRFVVDTSVASTGTLASNVLNNLADIVTQTDPTFKVIYTNGLPFEDFILTLPIQQHIVDKQYLAGATITDKQFLIWFNNKPIHSAPIALNLLYNAIARTIVGPDSAIKIKNYPLPYRESTKIKLADTGLGFGTELAYNVAFSMSLISALFAIFLIRERQSKAKVLQFLSGIEVITFWSTHFIWDYIYFTILAIVFILTLAVFKQEAYKTFDELGRNFLILLCFPFSALPLTYLMSRRYTESTNGFAKLSVYNVIFGIGVFTIDFVLNFENLNLRDTGYSLEKYLLIYPHFALAKAFHTLYINHKIHAVCEPLLAAGERCEKYPKCCKLQPYFAWERPGIGRPIIYLLFSGVFYSLVMICIQYRWTLLVWNEYLAKLFFTTHRIPKPKGFDNDVDEERKLIDKMTRRTALEYNLVMKRLTKFYGTFLAVNQISVAIKEAECFGLLGLSGSGKSTIFQMLTLNVPPTYGTAFFKGKNIITQTKAAFREIGYCPQYHALFNELTGRETLRIFGMMRGIPRAKLSQLAENLAKALGFMKHYNTRVGNYSNGCKRKLNTALAIIGGPSVMLLDEPTSGMDVSSRRRVWTVINRIRQSGKTIILTSESMDECEALCTRMAILVKGEFRCLGAIQHLQIKYSQGLTIKIKIFCVAAPRLHRPSVGHSLRSPTDMRERAVELWVKTQFPQAVLLDKFQGLLTFKITATKNLTWSRLFGELESQKGALFIEDYAISQTNLEEIFLFFTKP